MVDDARRCLPDDPPEEVGSRHVLHSGTKSHGDELRARQSLGHARSGERCCGTHGSKVDLLTQALVREHVHLDRVTFDIYDNKRPRGRADTTMDAVRPDLWAY